MPRDHNDASGQPAPGPELGLLRALDELGRVASADTDLARIAARATRVIRERLGLAYVALATVDHERGLIQHLAESSTFDVAAPAGYTQRIGHGLVGRCAQTGHTVFIDDVRRDPAYVEVIPGVVSEVVVPVSLDGRVIAVLDCEAREAGTLRDRVVLLEAAASRLGVALENARLLRERDRAGERVHQHARELEVLNQIARLVTSGLDLRVVLQRVTDVMQARFGWEFVACISVDRAAGRFTCEAVSSRRPTAVHVGYGRELGSGVVGEVAKTGVPLRLDDVREYDNYVETLPGALSELCVPIKKSGEVIAVLNLESTELGAFHDQLPLLETVAEQVAGALANARLYREVERRADQLAMLSEVSRTAMEALDLPALLDRVAQFVHRRFQAALVSLLLVDEGERTLSLVASAGPLPFDRGLGVAWPVERGVIGRAVRTGEAQVVLDVRADPDYQAVNPAVRAELALPIRFQERVLGVMNLDSTTADGFDAESVRALRTLADQVAGAVRMAAANSRLKELFSRYVAPDLAEVFLREPERFRSGGERREVSVLFADVRGFTGIAQRLGSAAVLELLNDYYAAAGEAVFAHRGSINNIMGDGLMAVFGVPERLARHAEAAVAAALAMQRAIDALSPRWEARVGAALRVSIGVNAGEVIVGSIGDPRHLAFTVLGDVVNVAARLETEAKARDARILCADVVLAALRHPPPSELVGELELRGREGLVRVHRLL